MGVGALKLKTEAWSAYRRQTAPNQKVAKIVADFSWELLKQGPEQEDHAIARKIRPFWAIDVQSIPQMHGLSN